jgi:PAS domain S-box-containing protein
MADVGAASIEETLLRLTVALDAARELITVIDATPTSEGGPLIVFANAAYLRETGYTADEIVGKRVGRLLEGADPALLRSFREATDAGRAYTLEARARRKDGSTFAYEAQGQPFFREDGTYAGRIAIGRNVEERNAERDRFASVMAALEHADDNVFVVDEHADDGSYRVTFVNESVLHRTGYTRADFERHSSRILSGPLTDKALRDRALADLRAGRKARIELLLYRKDGSTYWSELSATPIADDRGRFTRFVMIERDVTDSRRRNEELGVLWAAFEHASDSIVVYKRPIEGDKPRIVYVNEATIRNSGFSRDELVTGSTGIGPLTDRATVAALRDALMQGRPIRARLALYRKDGSVYWGELDGRPVRDASGTMTHWISIERDITAAVERERALSALLEATRSLFGVLDGAALDPAFLSAVRTVLEAGAAFVHDSRDPLYARALAADDVVADERGRLGVALRAPGLDPRVVAVTFRHEQPPSANDRAVLALLTQTYAAAARNAASFEEIDQQRSAVLALSRMKGDLITMLANDLNNPLTSIRGFAEFLAETQVDGADTAVATTAIIRATERLVDLGKETLALARLEDDALVLTPEPVDYGALLEEIAQRQARCVEVVTAGEVDGTADPVLVHGLFETLIANAAKFAPPETPVAVRAHGEGDAIVVSIEAPGLGSELGLFVRLVVKRHGGSIALDSRSNSETRVVVRLPRNACFSVPRAVLLLERDGDAASYAEHVLRDAGYRVRAVRDAGAFARALADDGAVIAIVPDGAQDALAAAQASGVPTVELRKPYLASDLLRALATAS